MLYGWHGMNALRAVLLERHRQDTYQRYIAMVGYGIMRGLGNADFPSYMSLLGEKDKYRDTRTGAEIIDSLTRKLTGEGGKNV